MKISRDAVVESNREELLKRSDVGIDKYGVTLAGAGLNRRQLLQHMREEALDAANYAAAEIMRIDAEGLGLTPNEWVDDAANWGEALNAAAWAFLDACPEKSVLLFNTVKPALRTAILKYAELIVVKTA